MVCFRHWIAVAPEQAMEEESVDNSGPMRRSGRNFQEAPLARSDVKRLFEKIESNHPDTVVFKIKAHIHTDINATVFDAMMESFRKNTVCQAMYIQNISSAIFDQQLTHLISLLKEKRIWCINIGENYSVTPSGWINFCNSLPQTSVTHLYVSEHTIPIELKNKMRDHIRANRKKHDLHSAMRNIRVISRCTNMWWNPINSIRHQLDPKRAPAKVKSKPKPKPAPKPKPKLKSKSRKETVKRKRSTPLSIEELKEDPSHSAYWAEGTGGKGAQEAWKFNCICGEMCSSYENYRYHPTGAMYACTTCGVWSHVVCMLGRVTIEDLEELETVYCKKCIARVRREKIRELREINEVWEDGNIRGADVEDEDEENQEQFELADDESEAEAETSGDQMTAIWTASSSLEEQPTEEKDKQGEEDETIAEEKADPEAPRAKKRRRRRTNY